MYMGDAPADAVGITNGSTALSGFTTGRVLRVNGAVIGEYQITGTAGKVVMDTAPTITSAVMVTPALGVATATTLAVGGATIGTDAVAVTGTVVASGKVTGLSFQSGTPNGGTAGVWKLGIQVAAVVVLDTTQYIQLDVGGTLYKLAIAA